MKRIIPVFLITAAIISQQDANAVDENNTTVLGVEVNKFEKSNFDERTFLKERVKVPAKYNRWHDYSVDRKPSYQPKAKRYYNSVTSSNPPEVISKPLDGFVATPTAKPEVPIAKPILDNEPAKKQPKIALNIKPKPKPKFTPISKKEDVEPKVAEAKPEIKPEAVPVPKPKEIAEAKPILSVEDEVQVEEIKIQESAPTLKAENTSVVTELIQQTAEQYANVKVADLETASGEKFGRKATTWFSTLEDSRRLTITFNNRPKVKVDKIAGNKIKLTFSEPVEYVSPNIPERYQDTFSSVEELSKSGENLELVLSLKDGVDANVKYNSRKVFIDSVGIPQEVENIAETRTEDPIEELEEKLFEEQKEEEIVEQNAEEKIEEPLKEIVNSKPEEVDEGVEIVEIEDIQLPDLDAEIEKPEIENSIEETVTSEVVKEVSSGKRGIAFSRNGDVETLKFYFNKPVAAAVFERFGYYWIAFEDGQDFKIPDDIRESKIFDKFEKANEDKQVYRLALKKDTNAIVDRKGNNWIIEFDPNVNYERSNELSLKSVEDYWEVYTRTKPTIIEIDDVFTGDKLKVFPLLANGSGFTETINERDFSIEESLQGLILRYIDEEGEIEISNNSVKIYAPIIIDEAQLALERASKEPLFAFNKLAALDAKNFKEAAKIHRKEGQYNYAKFIFDQNLFQEASIYSEALEGFDAKFMNAASLFMDSKYEKSQEAFNELEMPAGRDDYEFLLWEIAINHALSMTQPDLAKSVTFPENFYIPLNLDTYPEIIRSKILLHAAESEIENGNYQTAQALLEQFSNGAKLDDKNYQKYLQALIFDHEGRSARAREVWDRVVKTGDRKARSRAQYSIIKQDFESGKIPFDEMLDKLDKNRVTWRGDKFEYKTLVELSEYYSQIGDYSRSLRAGREAITALPTHPDNEVVIEKMRKSFKSVMEKDFDTKEKAFAALSLYFDFEEIKPPGPDGDRITLALAEKLVEFDLIPEAKKVLQDYAKSVTDEEERAIIQTRVAILNYMNNDPVGALEVLERSERDDLPKYLTEQRNILRVQSLIDTNKTEEAMELLPKIAQSQANRFKAEIAYREKDWKEMVDVYVMIEEKTDEDILRLAIAYELLGMDRELASLRKTYSKQMAKSDLSDSFNFVTNSEAVDHRNLSVSLNIDPTKKLFDEYKERLGQLKLRVEDNHNEVTFTEREMVQVEKESSVGH